MEAALALCSLVLFLAVAVAAMAAVGTSLRCVDAARELARLAARGDAERGRAAAERVGPSGARIEMEVRGDEVVVVVSAVPVPLLPVPVSGTAVAVLEPGVSVSGGAP